MNEILINNLTLDYFIQKFNADLNEMYNTPELVPQQKRLEILEIANSLSGEFKESIIDFYFINGGIDMSDDNFDKFYDNFKSFIAKLISTLNPLKSDKIVYSSVAFMWTGVLTQLEKESKLFDDIGLLLTTQKFLTRFLKEQTKFYVI